MKHCAMVLSLAVVVGCAGYSAHAATIDDVITMAQKGESEEKQITAVENTPGEFSLGASEVLRLREAKVPEKVILAMLRHVPANVAKAPTATTPPAGVAAQKQPQTNPTIRVPIAPNIPAAPAAPAPVAVVRNPNQDGQLTIENLDDRAWAYMYEPAIQTIWISHPAQGSTVQAHTSTTLSMKPGNYKIRYSGTQVDGLPLAIHGGERSAINISRVPGNPNDSLNVSLFENGERRYSGALVILSNAPVETVTTTRVVQAPTVYYSTPPVYYYGSPYYYSAPNYYYGRGAYNSGPYYSGAQFNLGINIGGGHRR